MEGDPWRSMHSKSMPPMTKTPPPVTEGEGFARFGWSYVETADLRQLRTRIERGAALSEDEPGALARAGLRRLSDRLNGTPRRRLGYRTPREVFQEHFA